MATVRNARAPQRAIERYCDAASRYAWPLYDIDPAPMALSGPDLTATALLSYPVKGKVLRRISGGDEPYAELMRRLGDVVAIPPGQRFESITPDRVASLADRKRGADAGDDAFGALVRALDAVQDCDHLTSVFVSKVLHRKRPLLVPLIDSRVRAFYELPDSGYAPAFAAIHADLLASRDFLAAHVAAAGVSELHPLRALDIIIWMQDEQLD